MKVDGVNLQHYNESMAALKEGPVEGGFVECLFEFWKVQSKNIRARTGILANGLFSEYTHRFGNFIYQF